MFLDVTTINYKTSTFKNSKIFFYPATISVRPRLTTYYIGSYPLEGPETLPLLSVIKITLVIMRTRMLL